MSANALQYLCVLSIRICTYVSGAGMKKPRHAGFCCLEHIGDSSGHVHGNEGQQEHHHRASCGDDDRDKGHDGFDGVLRFMVHDGII